MKLWDKTSSFMDYCDNVIYQQNVGQNCEQLLKIPTIHWRLTMGRKWKAFSKIKISNNILRLRIYRTGKVHQTDNVFGNLENRT